ncbi:MAG: glycerol-3-phosphate dehydrogenase/oxidase [Halioglobus sp.]
MPEQAARNELPIDCAIIGGGVAGLWLLNCLRRQGYSAVLFEHAALGSAQTAVSQGIIHGGLKFALGGVAGEASRAVAAMPAAWRACLKGEGDVDLRGCHVLSEHVHLIADGSAAGSLAQLAAGRLLRGRVSKVAAGALPAALQQLPVQSAIYQLDEPVLDVRSLVTTLADRQRQSIHAIDWSRSRLSTASGRVAIELPDCRVTPARLIFAAGAGNEQLLADIGAPGPRMQRRPLQQVMVRHEADVPLFAHLISGGSSPRVTITSHHTAQGQPVWYLGGELASAGVGMDAGELVARAQRELQRFLPGLDLGRCEWSTLEIDRAENAEIQGRRPDDTFLEAVPETDNVLVAWPTKLALCPRLGQAAVESLRAAGINPGQSGPVEASLPCGTPPYPAPPPWEASV